jgi:hypothetical protein
MLTSPVGHVGKREWMALISDRLPHTRSRYMVVIALTTERISAALRTAVRTNCSTTVGALRYSGLATRHPNVAVTGYIRFGRMDSCGETDSPLDVQVALHPTAEIKIVAMPKRNLRVTKWVGTIPVVGVCTFCDRLFNVPVTALKRVGDAQESLRLQFAEHKCKRETGS